MSNTKPVLSICLTCRDGREEKYNSRGGERFAKKIVNSFKRQDDVIIRGVNCMSCCKRSCAISLSADKRFTYVFGDIDPKKPLYISSLKKLVLSYAKAKDGFLRRRDRPSNYQSNIIGRFPPLDYKSDIIEYFKDK